ncbi:ATP-dependent DNA helicase [Gloeopeniophorella convolvens]|nr:ATP-dependent DNA helicase [Gloeopeniophorella convolvens]
MGSEEGPSKATQVSRYSLKHKPSHYTAADCHAVFTSVFGYTKYKGKQKEIFEAAIEGADVLVVAPTGMGKSICFQVPAITEELGVTIVVSPLLALMKNQVARLRKHNIRVASLTSETPRWEKDEIIDDLSTPYPTNRLLYMTPEKLCTSEFLKLLTPVYERGELNRLVVDEAHCISEWGHDFREEYRKLGQIRKKFHDVPLMALTASATSLVQDDIARSLGMAPDRLFKVVHPFNRPNLFYEVRYHASIDGTSQMDEVLNYISNLHRRRGRPSSGIVYCKTRATCDDLSNYLRGKGLNCRPYHKGIKPSMLDRTLREWEEGGDGVSGVDVVCATIAFGMGIDKSDVRYIIHYDLPKSFEGYYQETGRAGRDDEAAKCILYYSREDMLRSRKLVSMSQNRRQVTADMNNGPPPSQRAIDSFSALVNFAENTDVCRHILICRYFGEVVDARDADIVKSYCDNMCDVCKNPEKTKKKKAALSPAESIDPRVGSLHSGHAEDDDGYPVPQVKAPRAPLRPAHSSNARADTSAKAKATFKPDPKDDDKSALPHVASTSTVLAPIGVKTKYVGPSLLRSRQTSVKRAGSSETFRDGDGESAKRPRTEHAAPSGPVRRMTQFRPPFKVPFKSTPTDTPPITPSPQSTLSDGIGPRPTPEGVPKAETIEISSPEPEDLTRPSSPVALPDDEVDLDVAFSQKIPTAQRNKAYTNIRKALHRVFMRGTGNDDMWEKLKVATSSADTRSAILSSAAKELEFGVHSMSASEAGYATRSAAAVASIKHLSQEEAWASGQDAEYEDERDTIVVLMRVCTSAKGKGKTRS